MRLEIPAFMIELLVILKRKGITSWEETKTICTTLLYTYVE